MRVVRTPSGTVRAAGGAGSLDRMGAAGAVVVVVVVLAMAAITERTVLTGAVPGSTPKTPAKALPDGDPTRHAGARPTRAARPAALPPNVKALTAKVRGAVLDQRSSAAKTLFGTAPDAAPIIRTVRMAKGNAWAFGVAAIPVPSDRTALPQTALFAAHWTGTSWQVALSGTKVFGTILRRSPGAFMGAPERIALTHLGTGKQYGLMLPWTVGQMWPLAALSDIAAFQAGADDRVLAAGPGRIYHVCSSMVMVVHPSGPATVYYGLKTPATAADGAVIKAGAVLGHAGGPFACGGSADQPETLFGLTDGTGQVSLSGTTVGGWTFHSQDGASWAQAGLVKVGPGGALVNNGAPNQVTRTPSPTPSPAVSTDSPNPLSGSNVPPSSTGT